MKRTLAKNKSFLLPLALFMLLGGILILLQPKATTHLFINQLHNSFFDAVFPYITLLGDGVMLLIVVLIFLFISYRYTLLILSAYAFSSLITQGLKHFLFQNALRPKAFFDGIATLHFVPNVAIHSFHSFPSGHATSSFALFFCLAMLVKNNAIKFLLFLMALVVSFSRVYLSQHFFNDIYAGSLIGVGVSFFCFHIITESIFINQIKCIDKNLLQERKNKNNVLKNK